MLPRYPHGATDLDRQGPPRLVTAPGATATKRTVLVYDEQPNPGAAVHFENPGTGWRSTGSSKCSEFVRKYGEDAEREAATPSTVIIDFDDPAYRPEGLAACLLGAELWDGEPVAVFEHPDDPNLVVCWADGSVPKAPPPDADGTVRAPFDRVVFTATRDGNVVEMLRAGYRDQMQVTPP